MREVSRSGMHRWFPLYMRSEMEELSRRLMAIELETWVCRAPFP